MKKYKIPAEVQREDRIFGPITMRRLIILCLGGGVTWLFYLKLGIKSPVVWFPPVFFFGSLTLAFAFIEPFGMRFGKFLTRIFEYIFLSKKRIWDKRFSQNIILQYYHSQHLQWEKKQLNIKPVATVFFEKEEQRKRVEELSPFFEGDLSEIDLSLYKK